MPLRLSIIILLTIKVGFGSAQSDYRSDKSLGLEVFRGFIYEHKPQISHLITNHPVGFRVVYNRKTRGDLPWESHYNFPDRGLTFIYMDYRESRLGKTLAVLPHFTFYLRGKREVKSQWQLKVGFGVGYSTNKFDPVTNNQNNVISTDLTGGVLLQFAHDYRLSQRLNINSSLSITHFSNGAIKKPNSGINIMAANIGLHYMLYHERKTFTYTKKEPLTAKPTGYSVIVIGGGHEALKIGAGTKPFFVLTGIVDKRVTHNSRFGVGLEWFHSRSLKEEVKFDNDIPSGTDFNRIGIVLSHELMINEFSIMTQAGYYLYDPYQAFQPVYLRLKLRRYFGDHFFSSIGRTIRLASLDWAGSD